MNFELYITIVLAILTVQIVSALFGYLTFRVWIGRDRKPTEPRRMATYRETDHA